MSSVSDKGLVVGFYENSEELTKEAQELNTKTNGHILKSIQLSDTKGKLGDTLVLYDITPEVPRLAVVGLGKKSDVPSGDYEKFENVRRVIGSGVKSLKAKGASEITIDSTLGDVRSISEGAHLSKFKFDFKTKKADATPEKNVNIALSDASLEASPEWSTGKVYADAQNFARMLMETPANLMTPSIFVSTVQDKFKDLVASGKVEIVVRDEAWVLEQKMGMFYGVAKGSDEPLKFLEIHYKGAADATKPPVVYVGKGVTFDSGGISIKPSAGMGLMRGDMGGAATTVSAIYGAASVGLPLNMIVLTPLCENMPSGKATKPGDVVYAMNGKSVEVDNTDAEGRLILGDALVYAHTFNPTTIVDVATLTGAIDVALGQHFAGAFAATDCLWKQIEQSGNTAGERMWRMPLAQEYRKQMDSKYADIVNAGGRSGGSCSAAMFLKEFVTVDRWAHLDIAGVMYSNEDGAYLKRGMTGKPVRTLIELAREISKQ
ncbi:hypothetical protein CYY_004936 [Polysphondylium violaceum]|uniref:Cytosol aminopeptidase domain-containing protein n=1 Tax=Polysphondylium violaceum TaxID=133409 RepID=A0A8J4PVQ5_9MYCE|nr:hypothetical protein CYY_004936 [Polysphondylium violaceum]